MGVLRQQSMSSVSSLVGFAQLAKSACTYDGGNSMPVAAELVPVACQ